jgi:hypothetical protein
VDEVTYEAMLREQINERGVATIERHVERQRARQTDWFCLRCEPWRCDGCGITYRYCMHGGEHGEHFVIVWPQRDDPNMYEMIETLDGAAAIVPFEESMGEPLSYYAIVPS